jgi:allophanate hydrolase subunit 2
MTILGSGLIQTAGPPQYGRQDLGYSPGGAQDRFSWRSGNILLGNDHDTPAWEIVSPPRGIQFTETGWAVLTGGAITGYIHPAGLTIVSGRPFSVSPGSAVRFGKRRTGQRTYLCFRPDPAGTKTAILPIDRGPFAAIASWAPDYGTVRVLEGPEYSTIVEPQELFERPWKTTSQMSGMGIRLQPTDSPSAPGIITRPLGSMISSPVCDGTVQLTPQGPIVLLRERQTVGGYPRILTVIDPDVDMLAQYGPDQLLRFIPITIEEAEEIAHRQHQDLENLKQRQKEGT